MSVCLPACLHGACLQRRCDAAAAWQACHAAHYLVLHHVTTVKIIPMPTMIANTSNIIKLYWKHWSYWHWRPLAPTILICSANKAEVMWSFCRSDEPWTSVIAAYRRPCDECGNGRRPNLAGVTMWKCLTFGGDRIRVWIPDHFLSRVL